MNRIIKILDKDLSDAYDAISRDTSVTWYKPLYTFENGDKLCLAASMMDFDGDGYDGYMKLAILPKNAGMSEYDMDFVMPYNPVTGDVYDTESGFVEHYSADDVNYWNEQARSIVDMLERGELVASACGKKKGKKKPVQSAKRPIQSMYVTEDISGNDLYTRLWSGGKDQFDSMIEDGADPDDILNACEELLFREEGNPPTMTELNDLIWFEPDTIREYIGLSNPIESGCHGKSKKKGKKKAVKSEFTYTYEQYNTADKNMNKNDYVTKLAELVDDEDNDNLTDDQYYFIKDLLYFLQGEMNNGIQSAYKPVKSAAQISEIHNATSDCFVRITRSDVPEVGKVNDTIPLYEFKDNCRSYAETTNGSYYVTMDDTYEGEYFVEFSTGDTTFAPEDQRDDPYYNESLGTLQFEVIWNPGQELCNYLND